MFFGLPRPPEAIADHWRPPDRAMTADRIPLHVIFQDHLEVDGLPGDAGAAIHQAMTGDVTPQHSASLQVSTGESIDAAFQDQLEMVRLLGGAAVRIPALSPDSFPPRPQCRLLLLLGANVHGLSANVHGLSANVHGFSANVHGLSANVHGLSADVRV